MEGDNKENSILRLVNPEFKFEFMGEEYELRKATLDKAVQYQMKAKELESASDPAADAKLVCFCIYLMLKDKIEGLTEEMVMQNVPADTDSLLVLSTLGFLNPSRLDQARKIQEILIKRSTGESSSSSSPKEPDGVPTK